MPLSNSMPTAPVWSSSVPNVYSITPDVPFLPALVEALLAGELKLGIDFAADPLRLADVTIYVPTQRAAKALQTAFAQKMTAGAGFLPRILPLGGLGADEDAFLPLGEDFAAGPAVIAPIDRQVVLANWVLHWGQALREAIVSIGPDGRRTTREPAETFIAVANPADAWVLAGELASLMDETTIEGVDWARFQDRSRPSVCWLMNE